MRRFTCFGGALCPYNREEEEDSDEDLISRVRRGGRVNKGYKKHDSDDNEVDDDDHDDEYSPNGHFHDDDEDDGLLEGLGRRGDLNNLYNRKRKEYEYSTQPHYHDHDHDDDSFGHDDDDVFGQDGYPHDHDDGHGHGFDADNDEVGGFTHHPQGFSDDLDALQDTLERELTEEQEQMIWSGVYQIMANQDRVHGMWRRKQYIYDVLRGKSGFNDGW